MDRYIAYCGLDCEKCEAHVATVNHDEELRAKVVFEEPFRNPEALRGIEEFSHLWLIWSFHLSERFFE